MYKKTTFEHLYVLHKPRSTCYITRMFKR